MVVGPLTFSLYLKNQKYYKGGGRTMTVIGVPFPVFIVAAVMEKYQSETLLPLLMEAEAGATANNYA